MAINFPNSPLAGQVYEYGDYKYTYDGVKWTSVIKYSSDSVKAHSSLAEIVADTKIKNGDWVKDLSTKAEYVAGTVGDIPLSNGLFITELGLSDLKKAEVVAKAYGVAEDNVAILRIGEITGVNYFYDPVTEFTYHSSPALTGYLSDVGTEASGVRTIVVEGSNYIVTRSMPSKTLRSVADLFGLVGVESQRVNVAGYHPGTNIGGGTFVWSTGRHNGGTVIDPTRAFPTDWDDQTQLEAWFADSGEIVPVFVRLYSGDSLVEWFGAIDDWDGISGTNNSFPITQAFKHSLKITTKTEGYMAVSSAVHVQQNYTYITGLKLVPISSGIVTLISAKDNVSIKNCHLKNELGLTSTTLNNPSIPPNFWGIEFRGRGGEVSGNTIENYETGIRVYGNNNVGYESLSQKISNNIISVKYVDNLGWANDGILCFSSYGTSVSDNLVVGFQNFGDFNLTGTFEGAARGGIIVDINCESATVNGNTIGEGFIVAIHNEASDSTVISSNNLGKSTLCTLVLGSGIATYNMIYTPSYTDDGVYNKAITCNASAKILTNKIYSDETQVSAIGLQSNPSFVEISGNTFYGTYNNIISGSHGDNIIISGNITSVSSTFSNFISSGSIGTIGNNRGRMIISGNTLNGLYNRLYTGTPSVNTVLTNNIADKCIEDAINISGESFGLIVTGNHLQGPTDKYAIKMAFSGGTYDRTAVITGNNMYGRTSAVAAQFKNTALQIVEGNLNNTFAAI